MPTIAGTRVDSGPCFLRSREQVSDCAATDAALLSTRLAGSPAPHIFRSGTCTSTPVPGIPALLEFSPAPGQRCARGRYRTQSPASGWARRWAICCPAPRTHRIASGRIPARAELQNLAYWRCSAVRAGYGIMSPTPRAQQFVPKRERVFSGGHDAAAARHGAFAAAAERKPDRTAAAPAGPNVAHNGRLNRGRSLRS